MQTDSAHGSGMGWLVFALMTVVAWGLYGVLLHTGQLGMNDAANGRYKAFLFVGLAYVLTAVLAPLAMLLLNGASWSYPAKGMGWSLLAGVAGAVGAFCVLLAFGAKGPPSVVMSIVFAGAPVVNAIVALMIHPPSGGWSALRWQFVCGIVLAALGGCLVTLYRPGAASPPAAPKGRDTIAPSSEMKQPVQADAPAPKGRDTIAQGNALGIESAGRPSPERAK